MATKRKRKPVKEKVAASVVVHGLGKMTPKGRKQIAQWLRSRANVVEKHGDLYSNGRCSFRQFYLYS